MIFMKSNSKKFSNLSDIELVSLFTDRQQCEAAFAELYTRYSQRIYAYCLRVTGNQDDAGDIFQETFIRFFNAAKTSDNINNIIGYLLKIARNLCLNYKRDKKNNISIDDIQLVKTDDSFEQQEMLDLIAMALDTLPFDYKEAFILRQYQGYSYKEISEITNDSVPAVKNRVWRAKEKIKNILSPYLKEFNPKESNNDNQI